MDIEMLAEQKESVCLSASEEIRAAKEVSFF